ncbi:peptide chain release factor aRF-1 [Picrophilus oshimae]|uniref:Peptide chain release factor subunit 1 n=2 Tax=Picrophilus torridus (strain ATCC 700027 / DSM 9790 / JCM 10055 / NBRC 100828 / KAW 2/3) TaxID=1122961 RepID=RF1_PICTO|nr:peptide chain release factor aRF-1 [Picrophilus oshimae]Q6KZ24.1 RecName: Full=Peptide chain release factor subunit 1; AltName: Full=Translation termination factor aRF1 [Picrophilus oshimae DSM 9789]AAT44028.1 eukaryotic peptide chain release factor subunit 1 [Picrophilus oshimae DSM 9789]SMD30901.1 peptide chain release factor subunit 1 (aeRF-1) [Picrophilus oshimae DSM 9789]
MESEDYKRYEFKKALEELKDLHGRGTELISLYIPPDKQISDVVQYLREEYSTSSNIKSKSTRKNVLAAIESIMSRLKYYKQPPETGLVFFVGHIATRGDQTEMYTKIIEPPEPIQTFMYKCDSNFHLEQLESQLKEKDIYGLIVIDRKEATVGFLKGTRIEVVDYEQSLVPSKHHQGGQSSRRFERLIEIAANDFFKKIGEIANNAFMPLIKDINAVFIGGPGATKEYFLEKDYLRNEIKQKVKDLFDIGYTDESGLRELVEKASESIKDMKISREKDIINRFLREIKKPEGGLGVYGEDAIINALKSKNLDLLIISDTLKKRRYTYKCPVCNDTKTFTEKPRETPLCDKDNSEMELVDEDDLVEDLYKLADEAGTNVVFVSEDSDEGRLIKTAFGGLAGIMRYVPAIAP